MSYGQDVMLSIIELFNGVEEERETQKEKGEKGGNIIL